MGLMPQQKKETPSPAAAALVLRRPTRPLTRSTVVEAIEPLVDLLQLDLDDTLSLTIAAREIRVQIVPRHRGKRLHGARVSVKWPIADDPEGDE